VRVEDSKVSTCVTIRRAFFDHITAYGGQRERFGIALDQRDAEIFLELPDLIAQGGLRNMAVLGGASEMRTIGQSHQVAQFPYRHCRSPPRSLCSGLTPQPIGYPAMHRIQLIVSTISIAVLYDPVSRSLPVDSYGHPNAGSVVVLIQFVIANFSTASRSEYYHRADTDAANPLHR
jgi:hypothetical protein